MYDTSISVSTSINKRNLRVNGCNASISTLCLRLCLCLCRPGLYIRRNDANISTSTREWNNFHSLVLVLALLHRTCKLGRCKHKDKRKERKLENSDRLSAYILVHHVGIKSHTKRWPGCMIVPNFYTSVLVYVTLC